VIHQERALSFLWIGDFIRILQGFLNMVEEDWEFEPCYNITPSKAYRLTDLGRMIVKQVAPRKHKDIIIGSAGFAPDYTGDNALLLKLWKDAELDIFFSPPEETIPLMADELEKSMFIAQEGRR
jgi:hypothetical protein